MGVQPDPSALRRSLLPLPPLFGESLRLLQMEPGLVVLADFLQGRPQVEMPLGEAGIVLQAVAVGHDCLLQTPAGLERTAEIEMGVGVVRLDAHRVPVALGGLREALQTGQDVAHVIIGLREGGIETHGLGVVCEGLGNSSRLLQRVGQVEPERWLEPIYDDSADGSWHYRRRARLAVKDVAGKGRVLVGFRERHAPYLTDMHRCEVLAKPVDSLLDPLSEMIGKLSIRKRLPQIEVAVADNAVALLFRVLDPPTDEDCAAFTAFAIEHDVRVLLQTGGLDSVTPLYPEPPLDPLSYRLPDFDLTISFEASDFVQINDRVNQRMVREAVSLLQIGEDDRVLDLYCGIGNFSLPMARNAQHVLGVEGEMKQVQRATDNARQNDIDNCEFRCADLSKVDGSESWLNAGWDRVLLDPARSGAAEIVGLMSRIGAARIVYVSCHPGTLARDAATLVHSGGYRLEAAGIIDMFAHTGHVESMAVFQKTTMP